MTPEELKKAESHIVRYGHSFDRYVDRHLPGELLMTKTGKPRVHQPKYHKMNKTYYQAQCSFRGLRSSGSLDELQARLQARDQSRDEHFQQQLRPTEELVHGEHERRSAERAAAAKAEAKVREDQLWPSLSVDQKAGMHALRLLRETFGSESAPSHFVLKVDGNARYHIESASIKLGLEHQTVAAPLNALRPQYGPAYWNVVGSNPAALFEAVSGINREATRVKNEIQTTHRERLARIVDDASKQTGEWDITGEWEISCPELEEYFSSDQPAKLSMTIFQDSADHFGVDGDSDSEGEDDEEEYETYINANYDAVVAHRTEEAGGQAASEKACNEHMEKTRVLASSTPANRYYYATFDFSVIEGVMRIAGKPASGKEKSCAMEYRWRGRETGEAEIQLGSDDHVQTLKFSQFGTKLEGDFEGGCVGKVAFTGIKVQAGGRQESSSWSEWSCLSESNYNRECVGRWH